MGQHPPEALNKKALEIIQRVRDKLTGRDFDPKELLGVAQQVDNLIIQVLLNMAAMQLPENHPSFQYGSWVIVRYFAHEKALFLLFEGPKMINQWVPQ